MSHMQVVFNADDFGLSTAVNAAVMRAHREGILTSASLMANMDGFDEAVAFARTHPTLGVGIHVNGLRGRPLVPTSDVADWVDADGRFLDSLPMLAWRIARGRMHWEQVEREWQAQIDRLHGAGIAPTHLDSEKHLHLIFPQLTQIAARLAAHNGIPVVRTVQESMAAMHCAQRCRWQSWKCRWLNARSRTALPLLRSLSVRTPQFFCGIAATGRMTVPYVAGALRHLSPGLTEFMFHPAVEGDDPALQRSFLQHQRRLEFATLCSPALRQLCAERDIQLVHYGVAYE